VVLDRTLLHAIDVTRGAKSGGWILLNSPALPEHLESYSNHRLAIVDATRIALTHGLGTRTHPIVNTAIMGAFARMLEMPPMGAVAQAIEAEVPSKPEENIRAAQEAYDEVQLIGLASCSSAWDVREERERMPKFRTQMSNEAQSSNVNRPSTAGGPHHIRSPLLRPPRSLL
jgi:hypothetical protein